CPACSWLTTPSIPGFFRLTFNQAGGLYIPLITIMMIQVCAFSPNGVKAPTVTMFVMVALMV
ncbi:hypothetical protein ACTK65_004629, partial [Escherichia coli]